MSKQNHLHFPPHLTARERTLSQMYLEAFDDDQRQVVLDELHGRLLASTICNPIGYLARLCSAAKSGAYPNIRLDLEIQEIRERSHNNSKEQRS